MGARFLFLENEDGVRYFILAAILIIRAPNSAFFPLVFLSVL